MSDILERVRDNPALVYGFIGAVLSLLTVLGLPVSAPVAAAIVAVVHAVMALVVRSKVIPARGTKVAHD